jgi:hypothetical protein
MQKLPEPLKGRDIGLWFKNTTFALFVVYGCTIKQNQKELKFRSKKYKSKKKDIWYF